MVSELFFIFLHPMIAVLQFANIQCVETFYFFAPNPDIQIILPLFGRIVNCFLKKMFDKPICFVV